MAAELLDGMKMSTPGHMDQWLRGWLEWAKNELPEIALLQTVVLRGSASGELRAALQP